MYFSTIYMILLVLPLTDCKPVGKNDLGNEEVMDYPESEVKVNLDGVRKVAQDDDIGLEQSEINDGQGGGQVPQPIEEEGVPQPMEGEEVPQLREEGTNEDIREEDINLIEESVKKNGKLSPEDLVPPDHMDVVRMEQDGHVNSKYHKEMFLGEDHNEFKSDTLDEAQIKLQDLIKRADEDGDGQLSRDEIKQWISRNMVEHFSEAEKDSGIIFQHLDPDRDGLVKWKEYYVHFLLSRGFDAESSVKHVKDYDDSVKMSQDDKDALVAYKFRWMDADTSPMDNKLDRKEFMAFRHPEHSKKTLETMTKNVFRGVDINGDGKITEEEFAMLPPGEVENEEYAEMDRKWQAERKAEFHDIMDGNQDNQVDFEELQDFLDPTNPIQAELEANNLLSLMDDNQDKFLSSQEIFKHSDIFISSKIVNFAANLHEEF